MEEANNRKVRSRRWITRCLRRAVTCVLALSMCFCLSGCWSRRELNTLGFVTAVALDQGENEEVRVTVEMVKTIAVAGEQARTWEKAYWVVESAGRTIFEAVRNTLDRSTRRAYWAHSRVIMIGEDLARQGIGPFLDFFLRDGETRDNTFLLIARGIPAGQLIQAEFDADAIPAEGGYNLITLAKQGLSRVSPRSLLRIAQMLENPGIEPTTAGVSLYDRGSGLPTQMGSEIREEARFAPQVDSTAVFKGDKLVGWLDKVEGRGFAWVTGEISSGIVVVDVPGVPGAKASIEILRAARDLKVKMVDGEAQIYIKIKTTGALGESEVSPGLMDPHENWDALKSAFEQAVAGEIMAAVSKAKELNSDIFGFGAALRRSDHKTWTKVKDSWESVFRNAVVRVEVETSLEHSARALRSLRY